MEKNNLVIDLNILYIKEKEIYPAHTSKHNSTCEKQIIILMILIEEKRMALSCNKNIICIITQNNFKSKGNFYVLNCPHSFRTENKLKSYEKVCKNKDFCGTVMA